jgi:hypothetical protein
MRPTPCQGLALETMVGTRDFSGRRWLTVALRSLHIVGVVLAAAGILGHAAPSSAGLALMLGSGLALHAVDVWQHPALWREVAGLFVVAKLALIVVMLLLPAIAAPAFWVLLVASSVVSHAPHDFRHRRIIG